MLISSYSRALAVCTMTGGGSLSSVAWSADGRFLFAGGQHGTLEGQKLLVRWADDGRGTRTVAPTTTDTITDLKAAGTGIVVVNADPAISLYNEASERVLFHGSELPDFRDQLETFSVAGNGRKIRVGLEFGGMKPVLFDLDQRRVIADVPVTDELSRPRVSALKVRVEEWEDSTAPTLDGSLLQLDPDERARSVSISRDARLVALGSEWSLRLFSSKGAQIWKNASPAVAWAVNITNDGRMVVVCYGDGTIRWHRIADGEEILALFIHKDLQRWVTWTPQGYYDASAKGDTLIGWYVNRGRDQAADFFPAAHFRERFYRPDVIARVLNTLDEHEALRQADAARGTLTEGISVASILPPVIKVDSPDDEYEAHEPTLKLTYSARSPSGKPITNVVPAIDGRPAEDSQHRVLLATSSAATGIVTVNLPMRDATIFAETEDGTSEPSTINVRWRGAGPSPKPNLYVLAVGVRDYQTYTDLRYADRDAHEFAKRLKRQEGGLFRHVQSSILPNRAATKLAVEEGIDWIRRQVTGRHRGGFYFRSRQDVPR